MASNHPVFSLGGASDSCASMTSESTTSSSANLVKPVNSEILTNQRESPVNNRRCCNRSFPVLVDICNHQCKGQELPTIKDGCIHPCSSDTSAASEISCRRCNGKKLSVTRQYSTEQSRDIVIAYHKLKFYMKVLFTFNIILIVSVISLILFYVIFVSKSLDSDNGFVSKVDTPTNDKQIGVSQSSLGENCQLRCKELALKLDLLEELNNLNKECCTLEDAVTYIKTFINRKRSTEPGGTKPALQLVGGQPSNSSLHFPNFIQNWKWDENMRVKQEVTFKNDIITILVNDHYFIFSRIHFSAKIKDGEIGSSNQMPVTHSLYRRKVGGSWTSIQSSSLKCSVQKNTTVHSSFLEGVAYLRVGDELKIGLTHGQNLKFRSKNDNYFGLFKV